jgi:hypothetical protein
VPVRTTAAATFTWLKTNGFSPVEIKPQSKEPHKGEGWSGDNYVASEGYFNTPGNNIGARLGRNGLWDVDVDCAEALWYCRKLMPETQAVFGRKTNPASHYLYFLPENWTEKLAILDPVVGKENREAAKAAKDKGEKHDPLKTSIIDLRGMGQYTVLPGSVHDKTGEHIEWEHSEAPAIGRPEPDELFHLMKLVGVCVLVERHLWLDGQRHDVARMLAGVFYFLEFPLETAEQIYNLVMEKTGDDDPSRIKTLRGTYKKADEGKKTEGATKLKAYIPEAAGVLEAFNKWFKGERSSVVDEYNERFAVVRYGSDVRIAEFFENDPPEFLKKAAFHDLYSTDTVQFPDEETGKLVKVPKTKLWWASPKRAQYRGITFAPGIPHDSPKLKGELNLWQGWGCEPTKNTWREAENGCRMWLDHLRDVICFEDPGLYDWCLAFFADIFRNPDKKPGTAFALMGGQGAGKTSVLQYLRPIIGKSYVRISQSSQLTGNFNAHFQQCLLLHVEEAVFAGDIRAQNILKDMVTSDTTALEKKGHDIVTVPNYMRMGFTSNSKRPISPEHDDRRYTFTDLKKRGKNPDLEDMYNAERDGIGPASLFRFLLDCPDIDTSLCTKNYITADITTQKFQAADALMAWWHETLMNGQLLHLSVNWAQKPEHVAWPGGNVSSAALYASYSIWCDNNRDRYPDRREVFTNRLRQMLGDHPFLASNNRCRPLYNPPDEWPNGVRNGHAAELGAQQSSFKNFPTLAECRQIFEDFAKLKGYEWDEAPMGSEPVSIPVPPAPAGSVAY